MAIDPARVSAFKGLIQHMIDDGADDSVITDATAKFKAKYDRPELAPNTGAGGMGDVKMAESPAGTAPLPYQNPAYVDAQLAGAKPGAWDAGKAGLRFAGDVGQSLSTGLANAAIQGVQDNWGHPVDVVGGIIKGEAKNLVSPFHTFEKPIQSSSESLQRMGVDNTPQPFPMRYPGEIAPGGNAPIPGLADQAGLVADVVTPIPEIEAIKASAAASRAALSDLAREALNSPGMRTAAEKAVLDNYAPRLRKEFAPENPIEGSLKNASGELASTLKESDLMYAPEKAKIQLNAGLEKVGGAIDRTIKQATDADAVVNAKSVLDGYASTTRSVLTRTGKNAATIEEIEGKILPKIEKIVANLGPDELGNIPLDKGVEFRRALQDMVKNWDGDNKNLAQVVAKKLSGSMNEKIAAAHPIYGPRLAKLNERYSALKDAEPLIDEGFQTAYGKATGLDDNARGIPHTKEGVITRAVNAALHPRETLMKSNPGLAERIANDQYLPYGSAQPIPEYIARPPTVTADELSMLGAGIGPTPYTLPPRTPTGRPALDKPPTYIPGQAMEGLPPRGPQYSPDRRPLPIYDPQQGVSHIGDAQMPADALETAPLAPRRPIGDIPPNGFPPNLESPAVAKVLNEAGRRPIVPNQARIDRLKEALSRTKDKDARKKLEALLREENYRFKKGSP